MTSVKQEPNHIEQRDLNPFTKAPVDRGMTQKRSLPIVQSGLVSLKDIRIAAPCDNDWNEMLKRS